MHKQCSVVHAQHAFSYTCVIGQVLSDVILAQALHSESCKVQILNKTGSTSKLIDSKKHFPST